MPNDEIPLDQMDPNSFGSPLKDLRQSASTDNLLETDEDQAASSIRSRNPAAVRRNKSLIRPERSRSRRRGSFGRENFYKEEEQPEEKKKFGCWNLTYHACTCCCCSCLLAKCGMPGKQVQEAWREKVALCITIFIFCIALGFLTFGFTTVVCQEKGVTIKYPDVAAKNTDKERWFLIHGQIYNIPEKYGPYNHSKSSSYPFSEFATKDISMYFPNVPTCASLGLDYSFACRAPGSSLTFCHDPSLITPKPGGQSGFDIVGSVAFDWEDVNGSSRFVYNGKVLDISFYLDQILENSPSKPYGPEVDAIFRRVVGKDGTRALADKDPAFIQCLMERFYAGNLEVKNIGCIATDIVLYVSLVVILGVVLIKFFLAFFYGYFIRYKIRKLNSLQKKQQLLLPRTSSQASIVSSSKFSTRFATALNRRSDDSLSMNSSRNWTLEGSRAASKMYSILLVTCYSEGEEGLKTTLDSLTEMDYNDDEKLLVVICDGIIKGSGNDKSTPDIVLGLINVDESMPAVPHSYVAIADGLKRHNMAKVYAGRYKSGSHEAPVVVIVKCGTPEEQGKPKPGNRGKRDSQIILMSFFNKVLFDDRMTPLDYDLFIKIEYLTGVTPDKFELVLMVDADTKVMPSALSAMVLIMKEDSSIMGMCGETKIENKAASWVTMIQVFWTNLRYNGSLIFKAKVTK